MLVDLKKEYKKTYLGLKTQSASRAPALISPHRPTRSLVSSLQLLTRSTKKHVVVALAAAGPIDGGGRIEIVVVVADVC